MVNLDISESLFRDYFIKYINNQKLYKPFHFLILRFVDSASLYNIVNKVKLVHEFSQYIPPNIPDSHPHRVANTKCHIDTVVSPDDGHTVAPKHAEKRNKRTKKNCATSWLYLRENPVSSYNVLTFRNRASYI